MTMKLQDMYQQVTSIVTSKIEADRLMDYTNYIIAQGGYKDLATRIAHDIKFATIPASEVCRWYDEYDCNDTHVTTLFKKVLKESYPQVWELIQKQNH